MSIISNPATNLPIGDPELVPLTRRTLPTHAEIAAAAEGLILSASGWRKVFAAPDPKAELAPWAAATTEPGRAGASEDSLGEAVAPADLVLAGAMALVFGDWLVERSGRRDPALLLGIDARPTGPALADLMARVWIARGLRPRHLFIVAAPEIMAYTRRVSALESADEERAEGFCYISASHNPPAHNGVKFGVTGGVLPAKDITIMIDRFKELVADPDLGKRIFALVDEADPRALAAIYTGSFAWKRRALSAYTLFAREVVTARPALEDQESLLEEMAAGAGEHPLGVIAEFNGSARTLSLDTDFLAGLGVEAAALNDRPRAFAHRIVPEGESLEQARKALADAHGVDPSYVLGYVPDCDGDRGNLVFWDERLGESRILGAQEVFALAVLAELCLLVRDGRLGPGAEGGSPAKVAVAVNDATSLRIEAIASVFGAETRRAETGEANVVGLAAALREEGYLVRILGEGSNGGNITHPAEVRDPIATIGAILKLLLLREREGGSPREIEGEEDEGRGGEVGVPVAAIRGTKPASVEAGPPSTRERREGLFHIWLRLSDRLDRYRPDFGIGAVLDSLPPFSTTSVFETRAALRIASRDQTALKTRYLPIFLREWEKRKEELRRRFGVVAWRAMASLGSTEREIGQDFAASGKGGLRLVFEDASGKPKGFIWMRGSGTEPVFRIMADIQGGLPSDEEWLLAWQTAMVREADKS
jgi:phosphoglucomutase